MIAIYICLWVLFRFNALSVVLKPKILSFFCAFVHVCVLAYDSLFLEDCCLCVKTTYLVTHGYSEIARVCISVYAHFIH